MAAQAAATMTNTSQTNLPSSTQSSKQPPLTPQPVPSQHQLPQLHPVQVHTTTPPISVPPSVTSGSATSPQKTGLTNWWRGLKSKTQFKKGEETEVAPKGSFSY